MTFRDFKAAVNALPAHDLDATPFEDVRMEAGAIVFDCEEDPELEELRERVADLDKEVEQLSKDRFDEQQRAQQAEDMLAEFKDGDLTVLSMKERMQNAEDLARRYRAEFEASERELIALRKRKGIEPQLFANGRALIELCSALAESKDYRPPTDLRETNLRDKAKALVAKFTERTWTLPKP